MSNLTVVIKTILRPEAAQATVESFFQTLGPEIAIVMIDDSPEPEPERYPPPVHYEPMPYDSGLSAGRNKGVSLAKTGYVFITDDDYLLKSTKDEVLRCLELLRQGWDLIGNGAYHFAPEGDRLIVRQSPVCGDVSACDITQNFYVARTHALRSVPWDEEIKIQREHADHFLRLKAAGLRVGGTDLLRFHHLRGGSPAYRALRSRNFHQVFARKHGFQDVHWEKLDPRRGGHRWFVPGEIRKLHLSVGAPGLAGWLNAGDPTGEEWNFFCDFDTRLFFAEDSFDFVYLNRVHERLSWENGLKLFGEVYRLLRPGGKIRVHGSDLEFFLGLYTGRYGEDGAAYVREVTDAFIPAAPGYDPAFVINFKMTAEARGFFHDETTLAEALASVGFADCARSPFGTSTSLALDSLEGGPSPSALQHLESLIMEATKSHDR